MSSFPHRPPDESRTLDHVPADHPRHRPTGPANGPANTPYGVGQHPNGPAQHPGQHPNTPPHQGVAPNTGGTAATGPGAWPGTPPTRWPGIPNTPHGVGQHPQHPAQHPNTVPNTAGQRPNTVREQPNTAGQKPNTPPGPPRGLPNGPYPTAPPAPESLQPDPSQRLGAGMWIAMVLGWRVDPRLAAKGYVPVKVSRFHYRWETRAGFDRRMARLAAEAAHREKARQLAPRVVAMRKVLAPILGLEPREVDLRVPVDHDVIPADDPGDGDLTAEPADPYAREVDGEGEPVTDAVAAARRARTVYLALPDRFTTGAKSQIMDVIAERLGGEWVPRWHLTTHPHYAVFRRRVKRPKPPGRVEWELSPNPYSIFVGRAGGGRPVMVETETETPHWGVCAGTGGGKTTTLILPAIHWRGHGGLVDVIDLKQESYDDSLVGVPGFRVHTDVIAAVQCLAEFLVSAKAISIARDQGYPVENIPPRVLLIDEFGSMVAAVENWWKYGLEKKGTAPVFAWFHMILMQGRSKNHRVVLGTHDFSAGTFKGTNVRDLIGAKVLIGAVSNPKWVTAFGYEQKKPNWNPKHPGRGVLGVAGAGVDVLQVAYIEPADVRAVCADFAAPPGWFVRGEMAPWISEAAIEITDREAAVREFLPGGEYVTYEPLPDGAPELEPAGSQPTSTPTEQQGTPGRLSLVVTPADRERRRLAELVGLREALDGGHVRQLVREAAHRQPGAAPDRLAELALQVLRTARKSDNTFPKPAGNRGAEKLYAVGELEHWAANRPTAMVFEDDSATGADGQAAGE